MSSPGPQPQPQAQRAPSRNRRRGRSRTPRSLSASDSDYSPAPNRERKSAVLRANETNMPKRVPKKYGGGLGLPGVDEIEEVVAQRDGKNKDDKDDTLKLRLDLNLDVAVELRAKVHGDITLSLLGT